jgi:hypothetical protein
MDHAGFANQVRLCDHSLAAITHLNTSSTHAVWPPPVTDRSTSNWLMAWSPICVRYLAIATQALLLSRSPRFQLNPPATWPQLFWRVRTTFAVQVIVTPEGRS